MPTAKPPLAPGIPAPVSDEEATFIKATVQRFYGQSAVVRNFGPSPSRLDLHVETFRLNGVDRYDCLGVLMTRIKRDSINLVITTRGTQVAGEAKIAYRQGVIL